MPHCEQGSETAFPPWMQDGRTRWSVGPIYSMQSRRLLSNFTIREHVTIVKPAEAINLNDVPLLPHAAQVTSIPNFCPNSPAKALIVTAR